MGMGEMSERIARMIENDANGAIKRTLKVAQSDVMALLNEFMDVDKLDMTAERTESGGFTVNIRADVLRFYDVGRTTGDQPE